VAVLAACAAALAQAPATPVRDQAPRPEVIVTGTRLMTDEAVTAQVVQALRADPYVVSDHMSVVTENGVVKLQGIALDLWDLQRALRLARRLAGGRRVVNELELMVGDDGG
jgi:osmotically-inducible protein OsmY